jgi:glyoxylase-like metal-dependent hydrolase (beta-lactamase superfamily II)
MTALTRRTLIRAGLCTAVALTAGSLNAGRVHAARPSRRVVAESSFAYMVEVGDGLYAVMSTPLDKDGKFAFPQTLCNGGIIVGDDRIVAIDGYYQPSGAAWVDEQVRQLFGRRITDVLCTHLHLDHTGGLAGFQHGAEGPEIIMTATTWRLIAEKYSRATPLEGSPFLAPPAKLVGPTRVIGDESRPISLSLGGRSLTILPLAGHSPSDLAVLVDDAPVTFGGDLAWWGFFPNYIDAVPSALGPSIARLMASGNRLMVTGHGDLVSTDNMGPYAELISSVEEAARAARDQGQSAAEAAAHYRLPTATADWAFFNPSYPERAIAAWFREWDDKSG